MFTLCVGLVFRSRYMQFPIFCSQSTSFTVEVDPHSDLLHICIHGKKLSVAQGC